MRFFIGCILMLCFCTGSRAQLYEFKEQGKWGLMDDQGVVVLGADYDYLFADTSATWYFIKQKRNTGLFHARRGKVFPLAYDNFFFDAPDAIRVVKSGKYGAADTLGNLRIAAGYDALQWLGKGLYALRTGKLWGAASMDGRVNIPVQYERIDAMWQGEQLLLLCKNGQGNSTLWNSEGEQFIENLPYEIESVDEDLFIYRTPEGRGLMNRDGARLTEPVYSELVSFPPVFFAKQGDLSGLLNRTGEAILPVVNARLEADSAGLWWFKQGDLWGLAGENGILIKPEFTGYTPFRGNIALVNRGKYMGLINGFGEYLAQPIYDRIIRYERTARLIGGDGAGQVAYDENGRSEKSLRLIVAGRNVPPAPRTLNASAPGTGDTRASGWYQVDGKWGLRDTSGSRILIRPTFAYAAVLSADPPVSMVRRFMPDPVEKGTIQLIDHESGRSLTGPVFQDIIGSDFASSTHARVEKPDGALGFVDVRGREIRIAGATFLGALAYNMARVRFGGNKIPLQAYVLPDTEQKLEIENGSWNLIRPDKSYVWDAQTSRACQYISPWAHGKMRFVKGRKWGIMDSSLAVIIPPKYDWIADPGPESKHLIIRQNMDNVSLYRENGEWLRSLLVHAHRDSTAPPIEETGPYGEGMIPFQSNKQWGYLDTSGTPVIEPQFEQARQFSHGLAAVRLKREWGYIDASGKWVVKARFREADDFASGIARVRTPQGWGYLDPRGKWIYRPKLRKAQPFQQGFAIAMERKWGLLGANGKWSIEPKYGGIEAIDDIYRIRQNGISSYQTATGQELIPATYSWLGTPAENKIAFLQNGRYGYLDRQSRVIIPPQYKKAGTFSCGLAPVRMDSAWGYIDAAGDTLIPAMYDQALPFYHGLAPVAKQAGYKKYVWGLIDRAGIEVVPLTHSVMETGNDGWFLGKTASGWVFYDTLGVRMNQGYFSEATAYRQGRAHLSLDGLEYIYNTDGNPVFNPGHKKVVAQQNGTYTGKTSQLYGLMDRNGNVSLEPTYEHITLRGDLLRLSENGKIGYLNQSGAWVRPLSE